MDNNVEYVLDPSQFSSGKEIEEFIREHVFVNLVVRIKIFAKFVH